MGFEIRKGTNVLDIKSNGAASVRGVTRGLIEDLKLRGFGFYGSTGAKIQGEPRALAKIQSGSSRLNNAVFMHVLGGELGNKYRVVVEEHASANTDAQCTMTEMDHGIALVATVKSDYFENGRKSKGNSFHLQILGIDMGGSGNVFEADVALDGSVSMLAVIDTNAGTVAHADVASAIAAGFSDYLESVTSSAGEIATSDDTGEVAFVDGVDLCTYAVADVNDQCVVTIGFKDGVTSYHDMHQTCLRIWEDAVHGGDDYDITLTDVVVPMDKGDFPHVKNRLSTADATDAAADFSGGVGISMGFRPVVGISTNDAPTGQIFIEGMEFAISIPNASDDLKESGLDFMVLSGFGISNNDSGYESEETKIAPNIMLGDEMTSLMMVGQGVPAFLGYNTYGAQRYGFDGSQYNNVGEIGLLAQGQSVAGRISNGDSFDNIMADTMFVNLKAGTIKPGESLSIAFKELVGLGAPMGIARPHGVVVFVNEHPAFFRALVELETVDSETVLKLNPNAPTQIGSVSVTFHGVVYPGYTTDGAKMVMSIAGSNDMDTI